MSEVLRSVTVINPLGIHMRPADALARAAQQFECQVEIVKDGQACDCKSILSILTLGADQGTELSLRTNGDDAQAAADAITELFERGFDELDQEVAPS
jgi:phosphotransferase system HPr (HPr) family protein